MMPLAKRLLPLLALPAFSAPSLAAPALWEIRDDDSAIWLFGSFHVLPADLEWRTELFDNILAKADRVVFEADIGPAAIAELGAKAFAQGLYTDGTLLTEVIDDDAEAKLREAAAATGLPVGSLLAMKPWFAANTISIGAMAAEGYAAEGVEFVLQPEIAYARQMFLESGEQQLDVLSGAPAAEQVAMLEATLDELGTLPKVLDKMMSHWVQGTPEQLADLFLAEMGGYETQFLDRLLYARNRNWMAPLTTMFEENSKSLVIVGAAHLIGEGSVLQLLEQAGYEIERIQ